jgi:hypothetical protein
MKMRNPLPRLLACLVSTLVAAWLLGGLSSTSSSTRWVRPARDLLLVNTPWFGAKQLEVRRMNPITVIGHRDDGAAVTAQAQVEP